MPMNDETGNQIQESDSRTHVPSLESCLIQVGSLAAMLGTCDPTILITIIRVRYLIQEGLTGSCSGNLELRWRDSIYSMSASKNERDIILEVLGGIFPHDVRLSNRKTWRQRAEELRGCAKGNFAYFWKHFRIYWNITW